MFAWLMFGEFYDNFYTAIHDAGGSMLYQISGVRFALLISVALLMLTQT